VRFRDGAGLDWTSFNDLAGTHVGQPIGLVPGLYEVDLGPGVTVEQALAAYRADRRVLDAEPDADLTISRTPNDPRFAQQWDWNNTGQSGTAGVDVKGPAAWDITTGTRKVTVAVMDTGVDYNHQDLYQNIWLNQAEIPTSRRANLIDVDGDGMITFADLNDPRNQGVSKITDINHDGRIDAADILAPMVLDSAGHDTGQGGWAYAGNTQDGDTAHPNDFVGWDFVHNTNTPLDDNGHGTHVAGTIGAMGNNAVGVAGAEWVASLMPCKFLDSAGNGNLGDFLNALSYAVSHGAKISNNSWAGFGNNSMLYDAIAAAQARGHIFVAAAGNGGTNNDVSPSYPSSFNLDNIVAVAATDANDKLAGFSNYGATAVDLAAPGVNILSTTPNNTYSLYSGTSMATPHVAGAMAMVWGLHPDWTYRQVIDQVLSTVDRLASLTGKVATGGRLDLAAAVGLTTTTTSGPHVVSTSASGLANNSLTGIRIVFDRTIDIPSLRAAGSVTLTGPGGVPLAITAINLVPNTTDRQFDLVFASQTAPGTYTLSVSSAVKDRLGNHLTSYQTTYQIVNTGSQTFSNSAAMPIPDQGTATSSITINQNFTVDSLRVKLNIQHTYDGDLYIHLRAPDGTDILLSNRRGGSGDNYTNTVFDDLAPVSIRNAGPPFTGSFQPEAALANLRGHAAHGTWQLIVEDRAAGDTGTLLNWSLVFSGGSTVTSTQNPKFENTKARIAGDGLFASRAGIEQVRTDFRLGDRGPNG
jgi:subtilisin family serine protease